MVSIVIPTFNSWKYLEEMINCVINQTYKDWQLIIVDDRSTDETSANIKKYLNDKRIVYVVRDANKKKGAQTCRNIGIDIAKGELICFFDADDLISKSCLQKRVEYMTKHPNLDFAVFPAQAFCEKNGEYYGYKNWWFGNYAYSKETTLRYYLRNFYPFAVWTNVYRLSAVKNNVWDDEVELFQDFDFNIRLLLIGKNYDYAKFPYADYFYRTNASQNSISASYDSDVKFLSTCRLFNKVLSLILSRSDWQVLKKDFLVYIFFFIMKNVEYENKQRIGILLDLVEKHYGRKIRNKYSIICSCFMNRVKPFRKKILLEQIAASILCCDIRYLTSYRHAILKTLKRQRGFILLNI